jgi:hypothetical protein
VEAKEHKVTDSSLMNSLTCATWLTCSCGWQGNRVNRTGRGHGTDIPPLPTAPEPPRMSREALLIALYGESRGRRRYYAEQRARRAS